MRGHRCGVRARAGVPISLLIVLAGTSGVLAAPVNVRYVAADAPAGGDGLSWATAYSSLQTAIAGAGSSGGSVNELWVKQGTYYPGPLGSSTRTFTFTIADGLQVYGGFAGTEATRDERDPAAHVTTLSGNLGVMFSNQYHVVTMTGAGSVLDGVKVTGGEGSGTTINHRGAGITISGSSTVRNCLITGNTALGGTSNPGLGAGVYCGPGSDARLIDCVITGNASVLRYGRTHGGGVAAEMCAVRIEGCTITDNSASRGGYSGCMGGSPGGSEPGGHGGGLYFNGASAVLERCTITGNQAGDGGNGIVCGVGSLIASRGVAGGSGGGLYVDGSEVLLSQCVVARNFAGDGGNGTFTPLSGAMPGAAGGDGGGARVVGAGSVLTIINSTMAFNGAGIGGQSGAGEPAADGTGWGVFSDGSLAAASSIFWDYFASEFAGAGARAISYSDVLGGHAGAGNINADPMFVSVVSDYRLAEGSPCIDAGDNTADADPFTPGVQPPPATDLDGLARLVDIAAVPDTGAGSAPIVDMGAYEVQNPCVVDLSGDGVVDFGDYLEFLNLFDAGDPRVDFTGDGVVDFGDYLEFLNLYETGC